MRAVCPLFHFQSSFLVVHSYVQLSEVLLSAEIVWYAMQMTIYFSLISRKNCISSIYAKNPVRFARNGTGVMTSLVYWAHPVPYKLLV